MDTQKSGSVFSSILVVIIIVGLIIFYLTRNNDMRTSEVNQSQTNSESTVQMDAQSSNPEASADAEFEAEIENLDTEFSDMNAEDLDI